MSFHRFVQNEHIDTTVPHMATGALEMEYKATNDEYRVLKLTSSGPELTGQSTITTHIINSSDSCKGAYFAI